jgi:hypothetical protein
MKVRFKNTVALTLDQMDELTHLLDREYDIPKRQTHQAKLYTERGMYGTYTYRVNLSIGIIKVLEVRK